LSLLHRFILIFN